MKTWVVAVCAAAVGVALTSAVRADPLNAADWVEHTFGPSPTAGNEQVNGYGAPTQNGSSIVGAMPTNTVDWSHSAGGGQGYDAVEHLAATSGPLVGDQSSKAGLSATFSLNNTALPANHPFTNADFGGELNGASGETEEVLLYVASHNVTDPAALAYGGLSEWWYSPTAISVTSMSNEAPATLTADFADLSGWTDISGQAANSSPAETAAFQATLGNLTSLGLSFGSGNYYSDGFGFSSDAPSQTTGTTGSVVLSSFDEVARPTPLPAAAWSGIGLLGVLALFTARKRLRPQVA